MDLQLEQLKLEIDKLQQKHGDKNYTALYGTGCIKKLDMMFLFMNPTAKNISVSKDWNGMKAPWLGLKNTWKLMYKLNVISEKTYNIITPMKPIDWTPDFTVKLYEEVAKNKIYLTNLARCTQSDARHVSDIIFRESRDVTLEEIKLLKPKFIIAFGNQVSSNLLQKSIKVSECRKQKYELKIGNEVYDVYPTYYPVGMGQRNMSKAIEDILSIIKIYTL
jgi:hypothetical protein